MKEMINEDIELANLIENWTIYCTKNNFIGLGSSRKVYRFKEFVIKVHLNHIGYYQSLSRFIMI